LANGYDLLTEVVLAIREDPSLVACFNRVLSIGASTQQVRADTLKKELVRLNAPAKVLDFIKLLADEKIAHIVLKELNT
jgi:hypothetical protein